MQTQQLLTHFELLPDYDLVKNLFYLGFDTPTPVQQQSVPLLVQQKNIIVSSPTGSGKTGAFAVASYLNINQASKSLQIIIISPTRELCQQTVQQCKLITGLPVGCCSSSEDFQQIRQQLMQNKIYILVATFVKLKQLKSVINLKNVKYLIIDEADEMIGKPEVQTFLQSVNQNKQQQSLKYAFFSATFSDESIQQIQECCNIDKIININTNINKQQQQQLNIKQFIMNYQEVDEKQQLLLNILSQVLYVQAIVFCSNWQTVEQVQQQLMKTNYKSYQLHSKLPINDRILNLRRFQRGERRVLVCTDIFGRGMDVRSVTLVINYDVPRAHETFVHRSGRCGRFGREGTVVSFESEADDQIQKWCLSEKWQVQKI